MISWPRVRITFALIGMISTLIYTYEALGVGLGWFIEFLQWLEVTFK